MPEATSIASWTLKLHFHTFKEIFIEKSFRSFKLITLFFTPFSLACQALPLFPSTVHMSPFMLHKSTPFLIGGTFNGGSALTLLD